MKKWIQFTKKVCTLALCAMLIPSAYEMARQSLMTSPKQEAEEGVISDALIIRKQGIETAIDADTFISGWPSSNISSFEEGTKTSSNDSQVRTIRSANSNKTPPIGPGAQTYSPVSTVSMPILGYLGGSKINLLANQTLSQMMSVLVETNQGKLIMIDGGVEGDAAHLIEVLASKGGYVDAWLVTHPHSDHIGALNYILSHPECGITVANIYYSFTNLGWYQEYEVYRADMVAQLLNTFSQLPAEQLHGDISKGQEIWVDNVKITVMNKPYLFSYNAINNSSVAYKLEINGKTAMFIGDMGEEAGRQFIADNSPEALKCDILQMAHHGQNGVGFEVYQILRPEICLWPTPGWLWNNDSGSGLDSGNWKTLETRRWMAQLGVLYHVCIKDGDQVIQ